MSCFNIPSHVLDVLFLRYPIGVLTELVILYVLFNIPGRVLVNCDLVLVVLTYPTIALYSTGLGLTKDAVQLVTHKYRIIVVMFFTYPTDGTL